jgi:hypothetical protein
MRSGRDSLGFCGSCTSQEVKRSWLDAGGSWGQGARLLLMSPRPGFPRHGCLLGYSFSAPNIWLIDLL